MTVSPSELFHRAVALGLRLEPRGDGIWVEPADRLPDDFKQVLVANKPALLQWLSSQGGWKSVPPANLVLASHPTKLTSRDARLVMNFVVRQINGTCLLCEWCVRRELSYWQSFKWDDQTCALAAAVDVACYQLKRSLPDALDLLQAFEAVANPQPAANLLPAPAAIRKPPLKWAGGKTQLVPKLVSLMPDGDFRLIEPFAGSGVVFLNTPYRRAVLADSNADLISVYRMLREHGEDFIRDCLALFIPENNNERRYYEIRDEFNRSHNPALFVYLNRHCFNGLCRYNRNGEFNVPFGKYDRPYFPADEMRAFAARLTATEGLLAQDFRKTMTLAGAGDVCYLDPPYLPAVANGFTTYTADGFSLKDQQDLADLARQAAERGAHVIVSNHDVPAARELYDGAEIIEVEVRRSISCKSETRGAVGEIIAIFRPRND